MDRHIVLESEEWAVRRAGSRVSERVFASQLDAIRYAKSVCGERDQIVLHLQCGPILIQPIDQNAIANRA